MGTWPIRSNAGAGHRIGSYARHASCSRGRAIRACCEGCDVENSDRLCGRHRSDQAGGRGEFQQAGRQRHGRGYPDHEPGRKAAWTVARANSTGGYDRRIGESQISIRKRPAQPDTGCGGHARPTYPDLSRQQSPRDRQRVRRDFRRAHRCSIGNGRSVLRYASRPVGRTLRRVTPCR